MLNLLSVKNYAVIADASIEFKDGLNILTGETGAGKSILLGALGTILGERVDTSMVRTGAEKAVIEGHFNIRSHDDLKSFLAEQELLEHDTQLLLRREIHQNGRSRAFVNDTPVQLNVLQIIGDLLVDLHGQHEHQSLLKVQNHLRFLDEYGNLHADTQRVAGTYKKLLTLNTQLEQLKAQQQQKQEKRDFYAFQVAEIDKVNPTEEEEDELLKEEKLIQHSERLYSLSQEMSSILYDDAYSIFDQVSRLQSGLDELVKIDESFAQHQKDCDTIRLMVEEMAKSFQSYHASIEFSPEKLEVIQNRLAELSSLKKKYNRDVKHILEYRQQISRELTAFDNLDDEIASLQNQLSEVRQAFTAYCLELSNKRKAVSQQIEQAIPDALDHLGMPGSRFEVDLRYQRDPGSLVRVQDEPVRVTSAGIDIAEFMISTNAGEPPRPLAKVASGGEISRIMLALKSVLAKAGQVPVLIFDEIDIGVSGKIARAVGRRLQDLARLYQVVCITHLPQIASMGNHHYLVEKAEEKGRTITRIRKLSQSEREQAVARLLAGDEVSDTHLNSARELLQDSVAG